MLIYKATSPSRKNPEHSKRMKGIKWTKEQIEKRKIGRKGYKYSEETKRKIKKSWILRKQKKENKDVHTYR